MSAPARQLVRPESAARPERAPAQRAGARLPDRVAPRARPPAARPRTSTPPQPVRRARRGFHPVFVVFSAVVVTALVVGAVSLSALLVQSSFRIDDLEGRIVELADRGDALTAQVASASSPARIARWARDRGMVLPEEVVTLSVPGNVRREG